jgi:predicted ATP-grasp superfamily ATP-dependent carboligase
VKKVFVYEYLSGGAIDEPAAHEALLDAGVAMRDALVADLLRLPDCAVGVASDARLVAPPLPAVALYAQAGETPRDFVAREARRHDLAWIVAPESDGVLAGLCAAVDAARWIGCDAASIALATHKQATLERLAGAGLATPLAFADDASVRHWVVKPDDGAGAVATRRYPDRSAARDELARRWRRGERATLEAWVDGEALSVSLHCRAQGCELLSANRQQIGIAEDGAVSFDGIELGVFGPSDARCAALGRTAAAVARALPGLRGFVGIDLVWHAERGPVVIEVNPRLTSAYVGLSAVLGRNLAGELLAAHLEERRAPV